MCCVVGGTSFGSLIKLLVSSTISSRPPGFTLTIYLLPSFYAICQFLQHFQSYFFASAVACLLDHLTCVFFAPSTVRPNSPVANEQNVNANSPSSANQTTQKPERTTAIPPARIAVLIQAKKQHRTNKANTNKNAKNGASRSRWLKLYNMKTIRDRTQRLASRY